mgnify:CR=1 FL=1
MNAHETFDAGVRPAAGVPLNPPVPQPQLMKRPSTGVLPMIGLASGAMSTMPPQLRRILRRLTIGNSSIIADAISSRIGSDPRWA